MGKISGLKLGKGKFLPRLKLTLPQFCPNAIFKFTAYSSSYPKFTRKFYPSILIIIFTLTVFRVKL